jgi:hypothetical protein
VQIEEDRVDSPAARARKSRPASDQAASELQASAAPRSRTPESGSAGRPATDQPASTRAAYDQGLREYYGYAHPDDTVIDMPAVPAEGPQPAPSEEQTPDPPAPARKPSRKARPDPAAAAQPSSRRAKAAPDQPARPSAEPALGQPAATPDPPAPASDQPNPGIRRWLGWRSRRPRRPPSRRRRILARAILALVAAFAIVVGWSVINALTVPGGGTFSERIAEWARSHYLGAAVTFGEWLTYQPPQKGGRPDVAFNKLGGRAVHKKKTYTGIPPIIPPNLGSPAGQPLPGEGIWKIVASVKGVPAVFKTYVRESHTYSRYYAGIVSMDPRLLRFQLRPGTEDPGYGDWGAPMDIGPGHRLGLVATFNSGFRIASSGGGFYLDGHFDGQLVKGAASEVYYRDGTLKIGAWGHDGLHMGPQVLGVRQNLKPIVVNGRVPGTVDQNVEASWGATLGGNYFVWRSGVGMTSDGRIIFVYGPELNVRTLAELLKRAGCVSGMELDINPDWMSFMYYLAHAHPANPTPVNLLMGQIQPADRYYYTSNRDFTAVFTR